MNHMLAPAYFTATGTSPQLEQVDVLIGGQEGLHLHTYRIPLTAACAQH
jgi:hypothetical protein